MQSNVLIIIFLQAIKAQTFYIPFFVVLWITGHYNPFILCRYGKVEKHSTFVTGRNVQNLIPSCSVSPLAHSFLFFRFLAIPVFSINNSFPWNEEGYVQIEGCFNTVLVRQFVTIFVLLNWAFAARGFLEGIILSSGAVLSQFPLANSTLFAISSHLGKQKHDL